MPTLVINSEHFDQIKAGRTDRALAREIGVDASTLSRVTSGKSKPGEKLIASLLTKYPYKFEHFFTVVDDER